MKEKNKNLINFYREKRPWGDFLEFIKNQKATVKILDILPKEETSLQYHQKRDEFWYLIRGKIRAMVEDKENNLEIGNHLYIKKRQKHRLINDSQELAAILEISFGEFEEEDEVILKDKYNRKRFPKRFYHIEIIPYLK